MDIRMKRIFPAAAAALLLALPAPFLAADVVVLKDGKRVEGVVTDQGDAYEVRTAYGTLSIRKEEVSKVVSLNALLVDADSFRSGGKAALEEALKPETPAAERKTTLPRAAETLKRALALYREAREFCPVEAAPRLDKTIEEVTREIALCGVKEEPEPLAPVAPPKKADPAAPKPAVTAPPVPPPAEPAKPAPKRPVPAGPEAAESEKQIKAIFKDEYQKKAAADRIALARKLLKAGEETKDDAPRFVALREARDLAAAAGDLDTALAAIDLIARGFTVDAADMKAAAFQAAARAVEADEAEGVFSKGLDLMNRLAGEDEHDAALKLAVPLEDLARRLKDAEHLKTAQARAREIKAQQAEWNRVRPLAEKLKDNPDDAEACLAVAKYHVTAKADWEAALPLLARCGSAGLKDAAAKDLAPPANAAARVETADLWWALAEKESGAFKAALQDRARHYYEMAIPDLSGLARMKVEKRLQAAAGAGAAAGDWIDLLKLVNPAAHAVSGKWTRQGGDVEVAASEGHCLLEIPRTAQGSYDLQAVFTVREGSRHEPMILLPVGSAQTALMLDAWDGVCGLASVDGVPPNAAGNPTTCTAPKGARGVTPSGPPIAIVVRVRVEGVGAQVQVEVNGRKIIDWRGKQASLSVWGGWPVKSKSFGLGACTTGVVWHAVRLRQAAR